MGSGFQFIDIILFAMIAAFLILRLRGVLGRRDGHEGGYRDPFEADSASERGEDNVVQLTDGNTDNVAQEDETSIRSGSESLDVGQAEEVGLEEKILSGLAKIHTADKDFNEEDFLVGARVAFEMILGAYASGAREKLRELLSEDVYDNFTSAIDEREQAGHVMEETLVGIRAAEITEADLVGSRALVTTKFLSEQVHVLRDGEGLVIDGNPNEVMDVVDFWTFARDTSSRNPNWQLVATQSLD